MGKTQRVLLALVLLVAAAGAGKRYAATEDDPQPKAAGRAPGHWPQWRGPDRSAVSMESGLLQTWPAKGPALAWKATGLGDGVASVAVAGGRVFTLGKLGEHEHVTALDEVSGKKRWAVPIGTAMKGESPLMRWLSQRTPTVDGDQLYAVTARGELVCLKTTDGTIVWRKSYPTDFEGHSGRWGWCDRPLVDGDRLICTPGGTKHSVVALDKKTGALVWSCTVPDSPAAAYSATTIAEVGGVRHYVAFLSRGLAGIAAKDGTYLWGYARIANSIANTYTPLVRGDLVFCANGYNTGMALLRLTAAGEKVRAEEVWFLKKALPPWHDGAILVGAHAYVGAGQDVQCVELATGKVVWQQRGAVGGAVSLAAAAGKLYLLSAKGEAALVEASPEGYTLRGKLQLPEAAPKPGATAPVVAGGRLYLRDDDRLFCYDIQEPAAVRPGRHAEPAGPPQRQAGAAARLVRREGRGEPDAVFVTTPPDVVEKMLELAAVKKSDVVVDLGCGDGRIVVTAARKYGCKAVGYDIDAACVRLARDSVKENRVEGLVRIEQADLFGVDLGKVDVVTLYLLPGLNKRLQPQLEKMKPGSRIVSHAFDMPGVEPDRVVSVVSKEDEVEHTIYLWTTPLKAGRGARSR
jgi:outer membrane protein assembly factor BamB